MSKSVPVLEKLVCIVLCVALCAGMTAALADGEEPVPASPEPSAEPEVTPTEEPAPTSEPVPTAEPAPAPTQEPHIAIPPVAVQTPVAPAAEIVESIAPASAADNGEPEDPLWYRATHGASAIALTGADPFARYTPRKLKNGEALRKGIDVSTFQETVDWPAVAASGMDFAIVRVGYRASVTGALCYDGKWTANLPGARSAGLKVGVYFFSQAVTVEEAREEAEFLVNAVKGYQIDLPLVFDFEEAGTGNGRLKMADLDRQLMTDICNAFCETVEAAGYESMVYSNPYTLDNYLYRGQLGRLWLASYIDQTSYAGEYEFWQCGQGAVGGVKGDVDLDFWFQPGGTSVPPGSDAVTPTGTPAPSATPEATPAASPTPTATATPAPTATPVPTATPSPTPAPAIPPNPFKDVDTAKWFGESVLWAYGKGIINGMSEDTFGPYSAATRGQLVAMLYRMNGQPAVSTTAPFTDLTADYYKAAVNWAAEKGIVSGYTKTIFAPNNKVTREQLAAMLYRMAGSPAASGSLDGFTDGGSVHTYAADAMAWAVEKGIITGYPNGEVRPGASATRAEVCVMLMRYSKL